ncbi:MAG: hypothetical protein K2J59_08425 [Eubacterium sp.]|nr:hypothetical protein [Eubacterium sp.]
MEIEELCTKFTADLSDFRKKMETFTDDLKRASGVTDELRKEITNAMNSSCDKVKKLGKEMSSLADKQIKVSETIAATKAKFEDYRSMLSAIQEKLRTQREEMQKLIDKYHKLTNIEEKRKSFLKDSGGIEGVRKARKDITDYIHDMSCEYETYKKVIDNNTKTKADFKDFEKTKAKLQEIEDKIQRAKIELSSFDKELRALSINPKTLETTNLSNLGKEIESLRSKIGSLKQSEMSLSAQENSLNSAMANTALKLENLKKTAAAGAESLNTMRNRLNSASKETQRSTSGFSRFSSTVGKASKGVLSLAKSALGFLKNRLSSAGKSSADLSHKLLNVTKSIRRIGIVALGLKLVKSIFGELRSIVSNYISSNEELNSKVEALKNSLGRALAPVIQLITGLLEKLMPYVISVTNAIADMLSSLGIGAALKSTSSALDGVTNSTKELSESQKDLYGFDQITKVGDASSDSDKKSDNNASVSASQKLSNYLQKLKDLWNSSDFEGVGSTIAGSLNNVISKINALDWNGIQDKVNGFVLGIVKSLNGFVNDFDWSGLGETLANGINTVIGALYTIVSNLDWKAIGASLAKGLNNLVKKIDWAKAGKTIGDAIKGLLDLIVKFIEDTDWQELGRKLAIFLKNIDWSGITSSLCEGLGAVLAGLAALLWGLIEDAWNNVVKWWKDVAYKDGKFTLSGLLDGLNEGMKNIGKWIKENIFQPFIDGFKKAFGIHSPAKEMNEPGKQIWNGVLEGIKNAISNIKDWVQKNIFDKVQKAFDTAKQVVMNIGAKLSDSFNKAKEKWDEIKESGKNAAVTIKGKIADTFSNAKTKWDSIKDKVNLETIKGSVQKTFSNLKSKWDSIKNKANTSTIKGSVSNAFNSAKSKWDKLKSKTVTVTANAKDKATEVFKNIANSFIRFVNKAIDKINSKLKISVSKTLSKVLNAIGVNVSNGSYQLFSIPSIPYLETGGIISKPTVAMVGEHGKEAVMPLENNTGWITQLAHSIVSIMGGNSNSSNQGPIIIPIYIGNKHITDVVIDDVNKRTKATGNCPIKI